MPPAQSARLRRGFKPELATELSLNSNRPVVVKVPMTADRIAIMSAKILIVEDQRDILELLAGNLSARGYEVHTAHTGLDALDLARRCLPDLIVLDLLLEGSRRSFRAVPSYARNLRPRARRYWR